MEKIENPICYKPNEDPYPLCKGDGTEKCELCCLYENMLEGWE